MAGAVAAGALILGLSLPWYAGAGGVVGHPTGWQGLNGLDIAFVIVGGIAASLATIGLSVESSRPQSDARDGTLELGVLSCLVGAAGLVLAVMACVAIQPA